MLTNEILDCIKRALVQDIGTGDATTLSIVPPDATMRGQIIAKQDGIIAGLDIARAAYELLDSSVEFSAQVADGSRVARGGILLHAQIPLSLRPAALHPGLPGVQTCALEVPPPAHCPSCARVLW